MKGLAFLAAGALLYALYIANGDHTVDDRRSERRGPTLSPGGIGVQYRCSSAWAGCPRWPVSCPSGRFSWPVFRTRDAAGDALVIFAALNSVFRWAIMPRWSTHVSQEPADPNWQARPGDAVTMSIAAGFAGALAVIVLGFWPSLADRADRACRASLLACSGTEEHDENDSFPLPWHFLIYIPLVGDRCSWVARWHGRNTNQREKSSIYGSGEAAPTNMAAPGYRPFFLVALFFAILHLGMLVFGSGGLTRYRHYTLSVWLLALIALILG